MTSVSLGDALMSDVYIENTFHNGMPFSTYDNDNDNSPTVNCAEVSFQ